MSLKDELAALKAKKARLLAEVDEEIRQVKLKIANEVEDRREGKEDERKARQESVLKLHAEGKSIAQIAATVGLSGSMVRILVDRAKRKARIEEYKRDREQERREEEERLDRERTVTLVVTSPIHIDGQHFDAGAQVRVHPIIASRVINTGRANFATEADYEAFVAAVKGETKAD